MGTLVGKNIIEKERPEFNFYEAYNTAFVDQ